MHKKTQCDPRVVLRLGMAEAFGRFVATPHFNKPDRVAASVGFMFVSVPGPQTRLVFIGTDGQTRRTREAL